MNKFLKTTVTIITIMAGIAAIIGVYLQISTQKPIIEIKTITKDKLTDLPAVDGLKAKFTYKDSTVNSLWKLNYLIINSGDELIIGEGNKKNIIKENITFSLPKNYKILEISSSNDNFPLKIYSQSNKFEIHFLQWKPNEGLEVTIYAEQLENNIEPELRTNEREIINGEVKYSALQNIINVKKPILEYLPKAFQTVIWWLAIIVFGLIALIMPIAWINELVKFIKYKKWYKTDHWMYEEWINLLIKEGKISLYHAPKQLPKKLWKEYPYPKPVFSDNEFGNLTLGAIFLLLITIIPLLIIIKI